MKEGCEFITRSGTKKLNMTYIIRRLQECCDKQGKEGEDGLRYFEFWRNHTHVTKDGEVYEGWGGAPVVVDDENFAWDTDVNIGNGSVCTIKLNVTTVGKNTYVRLEGVRVEEHVVHEGSDVETEVDNKTDGLPF